MKIETCSSCGKIIENKKMTCKTCKSNYCDNCQKIINNTCIFCGK